MVRSAEPLPRLVNRRPFVSRETCIGSPISCLILAELRAVLAANAAGARDRRSNLKIHAPARTSNRSPIIEATITLRLISLFQARCHYRKRGDGRRLRAQNARAKRYCDPAIGVEERFFLGRPSAFRTDGDLPRGHLVRGCGLGFIESMGKRGGALLLGEHDARSL